MKQEFRRMTIVAALQIIGDRYTHADFDLLEEEWNIAGKCRTSSKEARIADLAKMIFDRNSKVITENGEISMNRAVVEKALEFLSLEGNNDFSKKKKKFLAGLRFDGFEAVEEEIEPSENDESDGLHFFIHGKSRNEHFVLRKMLPEDTPQLDFKEAEDEVNHLLKVHEMSDSKEHLRQAISSFSRSEWASTNANLRTFFESYLSEIAAKLGCEKGKKAWEIRDFLGRKGFLYEELNEWHQNNCKSRYITGLWNRMHLKGSHPGLPEEDDTVFRLQITLITARLLLRRFHDMNME